MCKEKSYFIASSTLKIKYGKSKGMQEKGINHGYMAWIQIIRHSGSLFGIIRQAS